MAIQVFGGMGYIEETGVAQHWRDVRIAPSTGTNGIQAIDLVMRKLPMADGAVMDQLFSEIDATVADLVDELPRLSIDLSQALATVRATD